MGCVGIHLGNNRVDEYMPLKLVTSNEWCHLQWFYVKNDANAPLLEHTGREIPMAPKE